MDIEIVGSV